MPKRPPQRAPRPPQGRTDARAYALRTRTPQQPAPPALMRAMGAIMPGMGAMAGAMMKRGKRGGRGR
jgi:hypothetical protein